MTEGTTKEACDEVRSSSAGNTEEDIVPLQGEGGGGGGYVETGET